MKYTVGMKNNSKTGRSRARKKSSAVKRTGRMRISHSDLKKHARSRTRTKRSGYRRISKFPFTVRGIGGGKKGSSKYVSSSSKGKQSRKERFMFMAKRAFLFGVGLIFFSTIIGGIGIGLYLKSLDESLPDPNQLADRSSDQSTILYDRNGKELFKIYDEVNRQFVTIDEIPEHTKWALLAAEDSEFYQHKGLDWKGIIRCGLLSSRSYLSDGQEGGLCGASTITQQLVRNTIAADVFGDEAFERENFYKLVRRKLREILLSIKVEQAYTKDEILQLYMNEVPLGGVVYGYGAAAESYFDKDVEDLTLGESALLAGLIQSPSVYSPLYSFDQESATELSKDRQEYVFDQMIDYKSLTGVTVEEVDEARNEELIYASTAIDIEAYHFVFYIKQLLEEEYGPDQVNRGGLRVTTTLDLSTQRVAEEELINGVKQYGDKWGVKNGSMVVLDPQTNQILAMVGSVDPTENEDPRIDGSVNVSTSLRQMGSSFKPYVYLTAFERYGPWLPTPDVPMSFGGYRPANWDDRFSGLMVAREALVKSRNIPANYTMQLVGIDSVLANVEKMGITTLTDRGNYGLSLALGSGEQKLLEHAQGFSVFATGGVKRDVEGLVKVENSKGELLKEYKPSKNGERIFDEKDVYMVNWALCDLGGHRDQPFYNQYTINGSRKLCGKTGTTNGPKDLLAMQYHKNLLVAVWAGNNNGDEVPGAWSTTVPLPIANSFMTRMSDKYVPEFPERPPGILTTTICKDTGRIAGKNTKCDKTSTIYVSGRAPRNDERRSVLVCKENDSIALNEDQVKDFTNDKGDYTLVNEKYLLNFKLENTSQQISFNNFISKNTDFLAKKPPEEQCPLPLGPDGAPIISFTDTDFSKTYKVGDTIKLKTDPIAETSVSYVEYFVNGASVGTSGNSRTKYQVSYTVGSELFSGAHQILAKVVDDEGREGLAEATLIVQNDSQSQVNLISPTDGSSFELPISIQVQAKLVNLPGNIVTVNITKDGSTVVSAPMVNFDGTWIYEWNSSTVEPGKYQVQVLHQESSVASAFSNIDITAGP